MLSAQLIARYQPNVKILCHYLAHRLSTYLRTEITLFQMCLEYNLVYRKKLTFNIYNIRFKPVRYVIKVSQEQSMMLILKTAMFLNGVIR